MRFHLCALTQQSPNFDEGNTNFSLEPVTKFENLHNRSILTQRIDVSFSYDYGNIAKRNKK